jgi:hypothetical protein
MFVGTGMPRPAGRRFAGDAEEKQTPVGNSLIRIDEAHFCGVPDNQKRPMEIRCADNAKVVRLKSCEAQLPRAGRDSAANRHRRPRPHNLRRRLESIQLGAAYAAARSTAKPPAERRRL